MTSVVKCGSCFRYESFFHMACVTICANSMAARPGDKKPLLLSTSTQACISRMALPRISSVSDCSSADSCMRDMWACSNRFVLTCGSLYLAPGCTLFGRRCANWFVDKTQQTHAIVMCWKLDRCKIIHSTKTRGIEDKIAILPQNPNSSYSDSQMHC